MLAWVAALTSIVIVAGVVAVSFLDRGTPAPRPPATPTWDGRDPILAKRLAEQARQAAGRDPRTHLQLLLAAHTVDSADPAYRGALAEALFTMPDGFAEAVAPIRLVQTRLSVDDQITYAAVTSDGSFTVIGGARVTQIWRTGWLGDRPRVRLAAEVDHPVSLAAGGGDRLRASMLIVDSAGVSYWVAQNPGATESTAQLAADADAAAVSADGRIAVAVDGTTATVWNAGGRTPEGRGTLSYVQPPTALSFAPAGTTLAAGHAGGTVTVHTIQLEHVSAAERVLTSHAGQVDAVALSADASTLLAVHTDATVTVWDLTTPAPQPTGTTTAPAAGTRPWLSRDGSFAIMTAPAGRPEVWSLLDKQRPRRLAEFADLPSRTAHTMISGDGQRALTIDAGNTLTIWDLGPVQQVFDKPTERACQVAGPDNQQWRRMVSNPAFLNPCRPPPLPTLDPD
jgi:hypothetical protein